jgi:Raf kinase inhibitor-like YbhB/YbcL family protein
MTTLSLTSQAFAEGGSIPSRHSCDGADVSPPLAWSGAPLGTAVFALIVDDPDARGFVHWVAFDIPGGQVSLAEGASGTGGFGQGRNDFGRPGWGGPCPPSGTHRYVFELFALDRGLGLSGSPSAADVRAAMAGRVLSSTRLSATYRRGG